MKYNLIIDDEVLVSKPRTKEYVNLKNTRTISERSNYYMKDKEMFPTFTITKGVTENGWWHKDCIETYPEAHERA